MSEIKLDPESLTVLVQKALLDSISEETKQQVLSDAIAQILTVPKDDRPSYQRNNPLKSPLAEAFEQGVNLATMQVVREMIQNDPRVEAKIREIAGDAVNALLDGSYDISTKVGDAIGSTLAEAWRERRGMN